MNFKRCYQNQYNVRYKIPVGKVSDVESVIELEVKSDMKSHMW